MLRSLAEQPDALFPFLQDPRCKLDQLEPLTGIRLLNRLTRELKTVVGISLDCSYDETFPLIFAFLAL